MRSLSAFFLLALLFLFASLDEARKLDAAEYYWKSAMKGEPMPKAIEERLRNYKDRDDCSESDSDESTTVINLQDQFTKDFDTKPTLLIYHQHKEGTNDDETVINKDHFSKDFDTKPTLLINHQHNNDTGNIKKVASQEE